MGPIYRATAIILLTPVYIGGAVFTVVYLSVVGTCTIVEYIFTGSGKTGRKAFQDILNTSINIAHDIAVFVQKHDGCVVQERDGCVVQEYDNSL